MILGTSIFYLLRRNYKPQAQSSRFVLRGFWLPQPLQSTPYDDDLDHGLHSSGGLCRRLYMGLL